MALSTNPNTTVQNNDDGVLNASITSTATTITISPIKKWVNGILTTQGFDSTAAFCKIVDSTGRFEYISYDSKAVDSTTKVTTLTGVTRGLSVGSSSYTGGTGLAWDANTRIFVTDYAKMWNDLLSTTSNQTVTGDITFGGDIVFTGTERVPVYQNATARDAAITAPTNGMEAYLTDEGIFTDYTSGTWVTRASGTITNASESVSGKVELATLAEQGSHTETGSQGPLVLQSKNTIKTHATYTPAYLTGGTSATTNIPQWAGTTDGSFQITIDGTPRSITGINFTGVTDMAGVATKLQTALRTVTGSTETVVWSTNHFVISSANTTSSSAITVCTAGASGTDISGAGGVAYMDCDAGAADEAVTNAVLDITQDANKTPLLESDGLLPTGLIATGTSDNTKYLRGDKTWQTIASIVSGVTIPSFGDGSVAEPDWSSGASLDPATVFNYASITLPVSQTLTVSSVNAPLVILVNGNATINGTIDLSGKGAIGGNGGASSGNGSTGSNGSSAFSGIVNGGGGGGGEGAGGGGGGGGGGSSDIKDGIVGFSSTHPGGAAGTQFGGTSGFYKRDILSNFQRFAFCGTGGGGGGGGSGGNTGGVGGNGGGALVMFIRGNLTLGASSTITVAGTAGAGGGSNGSGNGGGGGGGGGGGHAIIMVGGTITNYGTTLVVNGGGGGAAGAGGSIAGANGGAGGNGSIQIYSIQSGTFVSA